MPEGLAVTRDRPGLLIAALAILLALSTLVLGIPVPMVGLGLLVLAAALGTLIRPEIGLHVLTLNALVGLTHVIEMPRIGPLSAPILIEALVAAALLFQMAFQRRSVSFGSRQHLLMGLLAAWILVSILTGIEVGPENFRQYRNLFLVRMVIFLLVTALITSREAIRRLLATILLANVGLLGVAFAVRLGWFGQERITVSQEFERTGALVQNPNELAFSLTTMLVLSLAAFFYLKNPFLRAFVLALAAADLFGVLSTLSRSGFISLCVVMLFLLFKLTRNLRALALVAALAGLGAIIAPPELFERFSKIDEVKDVDRIQVARVGVAMAMAHPLLGVGLGNYVPAFPDYNVSNMRRPAPSHNMYLDLAAQMGLPALAIYLGILLTTWFGLRRMERDLAGRGSGRSFDALAALALQGFLVNLAIFGLSGDVEFDYGAFILIGVATVLIGLHRKAPSPRGAQSVLSAGG